ncbi:hypothetical protein NHE85_10390 [Flavobacterium sp. NRK1]|nr:hypothetical protein [Flavobacterium sp. NRK1]
MTDTDKAMGYSKIWLGSQSLGTSEDLIYLRGYLAAGLQEIANSSELNIKLMNKEDLYKFFIAKINNSHNPEQLKYSIRSFGTFCDDFIIFSFIYDDEINIVWKLLSNNTPFLDLNNQSLRINYFKISKNEYFKVLNELINRIF